MNRERRAFAPAAPAGSRGRRHRFLPAARGSVASWLILFCLISISAAAHDVTTTLRGTGEAMVVFHYGDGSPMAEAQYAVFAPGGGVLPAATGLTDAAGTVRLSANADGVWRVDVHDAAGHASRARIDFRDGVAAMGGGGVPAWLVAISLVANLVLGAWVVRHRKKPS